MAHGADGPEDVRASEETPPKEQAEEDVTREVRRVERALFAWLVAYPRAWSLAELSAEFGRDGKDVELRVIFSAISHLNDVGLVHWREDCVMATLAAIRADELAT
jgi:predicted transcriptional regulator